MPPRSLCRLLEHVYGSSGIEYKLLGRLGSNRVREGEMKAVKDSVS
jgi:hypothetical protein